MVPRKEAPSPDIFAVQTVSRFNSKPGMAHWEAVKHIFRYLKGIRDLWLGYGVARELVGYVDADGSMNEDWKAISGYAFIINGGAVSWSAKRQEIISLSMTNVRGCSYELPTCYCTSISCLDLSLSYSPTIPLISVYHRLVIIQMFFIVL